MKIDKERFFLQLMDKTPEVVKVKDILRSPLGLADDIIKRLFENKFDELNNDLDEIKQFAAGITRANSLAPTYSLACYYTYLFSFHQYFNSSYRARQGKVLEAVLKTILTDYCGCDKVALNNTERDILLTNILCKKPPNLDADAVGLNSKKQDSIIIQLRSRDDTGGTTAKSSLVEFLKELLREKYKPTMPILYLLAIWDARDSQQKNSTIEKIYSSLKDYINISREDFFSYIKTGIKLQDGITIKLCYGTKEIAETLYGWTGNNDKSILQSIASIVHQIENWDDLWISYAIASLEIEINHTRKMSNIEIVKQKFIESKSKFNYSNYDNLCTSVETATDKILRIWDKNSIPFSSPSEQAIYIRDLLFLKAYYEKLFISR